MKNAWTKNVLSVGLSTGFVEDFRGKIQIIVQVDLFLKRLFRPFRLYKTITT